jgi:heterogeneous nuclear rnp K-like protein 2
LKEAAFLRTLYPHFLAQATTPAAMAEPQTPHETSVPSQKRPLEEPSSPSGPNDGPDAKRPALDKVIRDESAAEIEVTAEPKIEDATNEEDTKDKEPVAEASSDNTEPLATADATDKQGDTVVPDAPVSANGTAATNQILETKPKQSTSTTEDNRASSHPQQHDTRDETGWLHVRAIISSAEAATVIGKGGENVSQIRRMAGAKCTVSEYSRGAVERILTVSGLVDAVAKVCQMKSPGDRLTEFTNSI